jgi:hypothetical protein
MAWGTYVDWASHSFWDDALLDAEPGTLGLASLERAYRLVIADSVLRTSRLSFAQ